MFPAVFPAVLLTMLLSACRTFSPPAPQDEIPRAIAAAVRTAVSAQVQTTCNTYRYDRETLYAYINGTADLFLNNGFTHLHGAVCTVGVNDPCWISVDVYDLVKVGNTLAIFHQRQSGDPVMLANFDIACEGPGFLLAGTGKYYLEIQSLGPPCPALPSFRMIATQLSRSLPP